MTTSYPLSIPRPNQVRSLTLRHTVVAGANESPFTKARQVYLWPGERWEAELTLVPLKEKDAGAWRALFMQLDGTVGTFLAGTPARPYSLGVAGWNPGTPLVDGAGQTGESLSIKGLPASRARYLVAGDFIQLGSGSTTRLHMVVADVDSDSSGKATLTLRPRIKTAPADNAAVVVANALGIWSLAARFEWPTDNAGLSAITVSLVEPR